MSTKILYRPAEKKDCHKIALLMNEASDGFAEYLFHDVVPGMTAVDMMVNNMERDEDHHSYKSVVVAEKDGVIIAAIQSYSAEYQQITEGMTQFFPRERIENLRDFFTARVENSLYIGTISVDTNFRSQGIGKQLVSIIKEKARQQECSSVCLLVFIGNTRALKFYKENGFEFVKTISCEPHPLMKYRGGLYLIKSML
jgi:ribosomal protein S18 acetylase RimI-like enzyme